MSCLPIVSCLNCCVSGYCLRCLVACLACLWASGSLGMSQWQPLQTTADQPMLLVSLESEQVMVNLTGYLSYSPTRDATAIGNWATFQVDLSHAALHRPPQYLYPEGTSTWCLVVETPYDKGASLLLQYIGHGVDSEPLVIAPIRDRFLVFPLPLLSADRIALSLRLPEGTPTHVPVRLWQQQAFQIDRKKHFPAWGLFFGSIMALLFYNALIAFTVQEKKYFCLALFLFSSLLLTLQSEGFLSLFESVPPSWFSVYANRVLQCLTLACAIVFAHTYLFPRSAVPAGLNRFFLSSLVLCCGLAGMSLFQVGSDGLFTAVFLGAAVLTFLPSLLAALGQNDASSRYFLIGWSLFFLGFLIYQFAQLGWIPINSLTLHLKEVGLCVLAVSLSLGVASQIHQARMKKANSILQQQDAMLELKYAEEQLQKKTVREGLKAYPDRSALTLAFEHTVQQEPDSRLILVVMALNSVQIKTAGGGQVARQEWMLRVLNRLNMCLMAIEEVLPLQESGGRVFRVALSGAERFTWILRENNCQTINQILDTIEKKMQTPFFINGVGLQPDLSLRVVSCCEFSNDLAKSLSHCERALNVEKKRQAHSVGEHRPRKEEQANIRLMNGLRAALQRQQTVLLFQPSYLVKSSYIHGLHGVMQWQDGKEAHLSQQRLFELADEGGFSHEGFLSLLERALSCYAGSEDIQQVCPLLYLPLPLKCLREEHLTEVVEDYCLQYQFEPRKLLFEVEEASLVEDPNSSLTQFNRLKASGFGLAVTHFSALYGSRSYLSDYPVDEIHLNRQTLDNLEVQTHYDVVLDLVALCRSRSIRLVVQEHGLDTTTDVLNQLGCHLAQGRYVGLMIPAEGFRFPWILPYRRKQAKMA